MESEGLAREVAKVANLLALKQISGLAKHEQVRVLNSSGFSTREIAQLTGMTESSVRARLSEAKKRQPEE